MSFDPADTIPMKEVVLNRTKFYAQGVLGATAMYAMDFEQAYKDDIDQLIGRLTTEVLSDKIASDTFIKHYSYETYASWWDWLKDERAPAWFKKRYPVKKITHNKQAKFEFERLATYPKANVKIKNDWPIFRMLGGQEFIHDSLREVR